MRTRISSLDTEHHQSIQFLYAFLGTGLLIVILINIFKKRFELVFGFCGLLIFLIIGLFITRYYLKFLRVAFIDDSYLYITQTNSEDRITLDKIKSAKYFWYPMSTKAERSIMIEYYKENNVLNKILILPAHLDRYDKFKFDRNILGLLKQSIKNYKERKIKYS